MAKKKTRASDLESLGQPTNDTLRDRRRAIEQRLDPMGAGWYRILAEIVLELAGWPNIEPDVCREVKTPDGKVLRENGREVMGELVRARDPKVLLEWRQIAMLAMQRAHDDGAVARSEAWREFARMCDREREGLRRGEQAYIYRRFPPPTYRPTKRTKAFLDRFAVAVHAIDTAPGGKKRRDTEGVKADEIRGVFAKYKELLGDSDRAIAKATPSGMPHGTVGHVLKRMERDGDGVACKHFALKAQRAARLKQAKAKHAPLSSRDRDRDLETIETVRGAPDERRRGARHALTEDEREQKRLERVADDILRADRNAHKGAHKK